MVLQYVLELPTGSVMNRQLFFPMEADRLRSDGKLGLPALRPLIFPYAGLVPYHMGDFLFTKS